MSYDVKLQWLLVVKMTSLGIDSLNRSNFLFNKKSGKGVVRAVGGKIRTNYAPVVLEPTTMFHQALKDTRKRCHVEGKKFPYVMHDESGLVSGRFNVSLHLFGSILCVSLALDDVEIDCISRLSELQKLTNHFALVVMMRKIIAIAVSGASDAKPLDNLPKYYPATRIVSNETDDADWQAQMVALLTRHPMPSEHVIAKVLHKNQPHQVDRSLLLVDKQGIVAYVPADAGPAAPGNMQRFSNAFAMLELAVALRSQINSGAILPPDVKNIILSSEHAIPESVSSQVTWILMNKEFQLPIELANQQGHECPEVVRPRILIATVTPVETKAVVRAFFEETGVAAVAKKLDGHTYQLLGQLSGADIYLAISDMGTGGKGGSQASIGRAISVIKPETVIMAGIAFGIDKKKYAIGDILVSKQLLLYELQRLSANKPIIFRGDRPSASVAPLSWVKNALITWCGSRVEPGLLFSGEKLIDDICYRDALLGHAPDAVGGEMEGAGLYVACEEAKVDWVLVKAICDWADGKKNKNKTANQDIAAKNAAEFVVHLLKSSGG